MVTKVPITQYRCDMCGTLYDTAEEARRCERIPVQDFLYKEGDLVRIKHGDGKGETARIISRFRYGKNAPPCIRHKAAYEARLTSWGVRILIQDIDIDII